MLTIIIITTINVTRLQLIYDQTGDKTCDIKAISGFLRILNVPFNFQHNQAINN
jgi:hypothetical protein